VFLDEYYFIDRVKQFSTDSTPFFFFIEISAEKPHKIGCEDMVL
jgi:hypothetical protein